mgnify:CR=1 FL=1
MCVSSGFVQLVRGELPMLARLTLGALVVIDVHARDVIQRLADGGVTDIGDFEWISQVCAVRFSLILCIGLCSLYAVCLFVRCSDF